MILVLLISLGIVIMTIREAFLFFWDMGPLGIIASVVLTIELLFMLLLVGGGDGESQNDENRESEDRETDDDDDLLLDYYIWRQFNDKHKKRK